MKRPCGVHTDAPSAKQPLSSVREVVPPIGSHEAPAQAGVSPQQAASAATPVGEPRDSAWEGYSGQLILPNQQPATMGNRMPDAFLQQAALQQEMPPRLAPGRTA